LLPLSSNEQLIEYLYVFGAVWELPAVLFNKTGGESGTVDIMGICVPLCTWIQLPYPMVM